MSQLLNVAMRAQGRADALNFAQRAPNLNGTEIINEEEKAPAWSSTADYSTAAPGVPVSDSGQVWILLVPHRAADYQGRPANLRSLWGLAHTKDPAKAKPWVASYGTSGLYMSGECCLYVNPADGFVHVNRCTVDNNDFPPYTINAESRWEDLGPAPYVSTAPDDDLKENSGLLSED